MKKLNKKGLGVLYGVLLFSFSTYALLDTFVIPHPMQSVMASNVVAGTGIKESVEAAIEEKLKSTDNSTEKVVNNTDAISGSTANTSNSNTLTDVQTVDGGTVIGEACKFYERAWCSGCLQSGRWRFFHHGV